MPRGSSKIKWALLGPVPGLCCKLFLRPMHLAPLNPKPLKPPKIYSLHCSSFFGLPFRILNIDLVKPKKGTTMETIYRVDE